MKKIIYFIIPLIAIAAVSCNPLDDTYSQLDKDASLVNGVKRIPTDVTITLTEADYGLLKGETATGAANAAKYFDFSSNTEAAALVPIILTKKYPIPAKNSTAIVTYKVYNQVKYKNVTSYTLVKEDYDAAGGSIANYGNLNSDAQIETMATIVAPKVFPGVTLADGYTIALTYDYYKVGTTTSNVIYWGGNWHKPYNLVKADYTAMTQSYADFDDKTLASLFISNYMNVKFPKNNAGEFKAIIYAYYASGKTTDVLLMFKNDGTKWNLLSDVQDFTAQFGFDGTSWKVDNTIKYTLIPADYLAMSTAASSASDAAKTSLGKYNDFDLSLWTDKDLINELIGNRLLQIFPDAAEGQKYLVTYATYNPSGNTQVHFELQSGKYVVIE